MAFEFQRSVLVDGEWVSRSADVYQVMARNQDSEESTASSELETKSGEPVPNLGILSRTVIATPLTKFILPASIRRKDLNDVLYVGEDFVQLKEICDYGHLRHVATKSDFKGKILAARVFGEPRKVHVSTSEHNPLLKRATIHRARRSITSSEETVLPPDIAVLTLSSRTLMFLWVSQSHSGRVTFHQKTLRLPGGQSHLDRPGHHLAIDPKRRALAVAAYEGLFVVYRTMKPDVWRREMRNGYDGLPIVDEAIISLEGRVMHMEFLSSGTQDDDQVILAFILVQDGKTKVVSYEWDFRDGLKHSANGMKRAFVDFDDLNPSLLIPLNHSADFLLVSDAHISIYRQLLSGVPEHTLIPIPGHILAPLRPGASKNIPRWVQWDKALRIPDFGKEVFYIAREDGMVMYVEIGVKDHRSIEISIAGTWPYPIDTTFAFLVVDNSEFAHCYPDVLITGGVGGDGLVCKIGAWPTEYLYTPGVQENKFSFLESIPCWAPLADVTVAKTSIGRALADRHRIFVTNGKSPRGEISELRWGLKAVMDGSFQGMKGCTGVWVLHQGVTTMEQNGRAVERPFVTFIFALPPETIVICATRVLKDGSEDEDESLARESWEIMQIPSEEEAIQDSIIRAEETIAACILNNDYAVQISRNEVRTLRRPVLTGAGLYTPPSPLLGASTKSNIPHVALSFRLGGHSNAVVELAPIHADGAIENDPEKRPRFDLPCDPTCVELLPFNDGDDFFVFVGTVDARIYLFELEHGSLKVAYQTQLVHDSGQNLPIICESVVLLETNERLQLICGTRDGYLISVSLQATQNGYQSGPRSVIRIGSTAVHIRPCATDPAAAFMACGPEFCRVSCSPFESRAIDVDPIWLVDHPITPTMYSQGPIVALDQLPFAKASANDTRDLGGVIFAVSGEEMIFAQLDYDVRWSGQNGQPAEQSKLVPRRIPTKASPMKLMYMEGTTHYMVVATMENKEVRSPPSGYRTVESTLKFLRLDSSSNGLAESDIKQEDGGSNEDKLVTYKFPLESYERVYSMVEWVIDGDRGKKYKLLVVGTGITRGPEKEDGRRLFFNAGGKSGVKLIKEIPHDSPVRCLAIFDNTYLVGVIGKAIRVWEFLSTSQKWPVRAEKQLPSIGVHMTISEDFVYVSTANDSLICYQIRPFGTDGQMQLAQIFTDSRQRSSTHHLVYDVSQPSGGSSSSSSSAQTSSRLVLLADKTCSITGLFHPTEPTQKSATPTIFEANLPRSVIRIHRADVRPPWRRSYISTTPPLPPSSSTSPSSSALISPPPLDSPSPAGVLADDILGACSDGTIYTFSLLTPSALRLLRLTQNIIETKRKRDPTLQYTSVKARSSDIFRVLLNGAEGVQDTLIKVRDVDPGALGDSSGGSAGAGVGKARFLHVDGDLLKRWRAGGGEVRELLEVGCEGAVSALFVRCVADLFGNNTSSGMSGGEDETAAAAAMDMAEKWIDDVLLELL
ncbi:hypothetical protein DM02DRAFT_529340 [Periconia macrospinosa]|uniref:Cleavage/polyadenylation specificity factor A subunit N-terminal domain-containing protein n=1 Tax=Periconia macrospinosa TaxID=97972 RepID=A0A2V1DM68_9PLEO|nr:hypothetical protein DM02DRAFT_529340 [Periconia macrospinosa]